MTSEQNNKVPMDAQRDIEPEQAEVAKISADAPDEVAPVEATEYPAAGAVQTDDPVHEDDDEDAPSAVAHMAAELYEDAEPLAVQAEIIQTEDDPADDDDHRQQTDDGEPERGVADGVADGVAEAASAVGAFFQEGVGAVREMSAARRAHAEAREQLESLDRTISDAEAELAHRRDVAANYQTIIADETARRQAAETARDQARAQQEATAKQIDALKDQLKRMKEDDAQTEKRLKAAVDSAEAQEASAREQGARLQRRLDDAKKNLDRAQTEQTSGVAAAQAAVDSASSRLEALRQEYAEIQRNPSANPAAYNVRSQELDAEISNAADDLRRAQADLPRITAELDAAVEAARGAVAENEKPIDAAKKAFRDMTASADDARDAYQTAKKNAQERQRVLKGTIADQEKAKREQEQAEKDAEEEICAAQATIDEAEDIHAHPEVTETIAARLEADRAERGEQEREVAALAEAERAVRERTRGSRWRFGAVIAAIIALVIIVLIVIFVVL